MNTAPIYEHGFDEETLRDLNALRQSRLEMTRMQLVDVDSTLAEMISRGLIEATDKAELAAELEAELRAKIELLESRLLDPNAIYMDEVEFLSSLIE